MGVEETMNRVAPIALIALAVLVAWWLYAPPVAYR